MQDTGVFPGRIPLHGRQWRHERKGRPLEIRKTPRRHVRPLAMVLWMQVRQNGLVEAAYEGPDMQTGSVALPLERRISRRGPRPSGPVELWEALPWRRRGSAERRRMAVWVWDARTGRLGMLEMACVAPSRLFIVSDTARWAFDPGLRACEVDDGPRNHMKGGAKICGEAEAGGEKGNDTS